MQSSKSHTRGGHPSWLLIILAILIASTGLPSLAQNKRDKRVSDFGSSLKKLKWDPETKEAAGTSSSSVAQTDSEDVVHFNTTLVAWDVLVVDRQNRPVIGLTQNDFQISEDGRPQQVEHFLKGDNSKLPRSIVLIIDYSGSQFPYIKNSVESAKVLVDKLGPLDRMALVTDDVEMLVNFTSDKKELRGKLDLLVERNKGKNGLLGIGGAPRQFGRSAQYSALMATLMEAFGETDKRPIVVFQTDGDEAVYLRNSIITPTVPRNLPLEIRSQVQEEVQQRLKLQQEGITEFSLDDVYRMVEKSRATIYTVIPGIKLIGYSPDEQLRRLKADDERRLSEWLSSVKPNVKKAFLARDEDRQKRMTPEIWDMRVTEAVKIQTALSAIAPMTGGRTEFLETPAQAEEIYSRIFSDINDRYVIGYYPQNKSRDGKRRLIEVGIKQHPEYSVIGRKSYYAPS